MMESKHWWGLGGIAIGVLSLTAIALVYGVPDTERISALEAQVSEQHDMNAELSLQVGPLEREVIKLQQDLSTCQGAQVDSEASLEDFYQALMFFKGRFDMVFFDENGTPNRLVFDCGTGGDEK
jgi:uncharacterized coiled-coil protein SlyX